MFEQISTTIKTNQQTIYMSNKFSRLKKYITHGNLVYHIKDSIIINFQVTLINLEIDVRNC